MVFKKVGTENIELKKDENRSVSADEGGLSDGGEEVVGIDTHQTIYSYLYH